MAILTPKDFIQTVFIDELGQLVNSHPYISFITIGIGIEFLGKCIDTNEQDWNKPGNSGRHFKKTVNELTSLSKYRPFLNSHKLYKSFRCGLAHAAAPNYCVTLSSKNESGNLTILNNRLNLKIEDLYADFKNACLEVINRNFALTDKMNTPYLEVPDISPNSQTITYSGAT